jgi:hypothetical protein
MHTHADAEEDRTPEIVPPISPRAPWRVAEVNAQPGFRLRVRFNDGTEGEVNMAALMHSPIHPMRAYSPLCATRCCFARFVLNWAR